MIIENEGTYTLKYTATDSCGKTTEVDRELVVKDIPKVYGIFWDSGKSSPSLERTDLSADFADPSPAVNNGTGSSPFDDIMPWSGIEVVEDATAGTLVKIPKYFYKITWEGESETTLNNMRLQISPQEQDGFLVSPAHADRGDGVGERDFVYVGRYHCCDTNYKSLTGIVPKTRMTRADFRTSIHNLGADIWQYDYAMFWTIAMLYLVEFADWNSQAKIGIGCGNGSAKEAMGATDAMQYHTGTNAMDRTTYGQVQYRHIEGLWSNVEDWCDGIYFDSTNSYAIKNPADFSDTSNGTSLGAIWITNHYIRRYSHGIPGFEYALMPQTNTTASGTTYVCDHSNNTDSTNVLAVGGFYTQNASNVPQFGLFHQDRNTTSRTRDWIGSRLMKLPSA